MMRRQENGGAKIIMMKFKTFLESVLFYLSAPKCVCFKKRLDRLNFALCDECLKEYNNIKNRTCSVCFKRLDSCSCVNHHLNTHYVKGLAKIFRYKQDGNVPSNRLIYSLKRDNRRDVLKFVTDELETSIRNSYKNIEDFVFTNVPRRKSSVIEYGIDHAALLSKSLAKRFSATYYQPIISKSKEQQKKTSGEERMKNAMFRLKKNAQELKGKTVIIIDDVVTTGASMGACAMLLKGLGAKKILGASIAIAFKDEYTPFEYTKY